MYSEYKVLVSIVSMTTWLKKSAIHITKSILHQFARGMAFQQMFQDLHKLTIIIIPHNM